MHRSEAESFCIEDDHHRGIRYVDSDFYDGCRNQHARIPFFKIEHRLFFFIGDMDISIIKTKPKGRKEVKTELVKTKDIINSSVILK